MRMCLTCDCRVGRPGNMYCRRCVAGFLAWQSKTGGTLIQYAQEQAARHHQAVPR